MTVAVFGIDGTRYGRTDGIRRCVKGENGIDLKPFFGSAAGAGIVVVRGAGMTLTQRVVFNGK